MATTSQSAVTQVQIFKTLADPTRLAILRLLKHTDHEMTCGEVGARLAISKTAGRIISNCCSPLA